MEKMNKNLNNISCYHANYLEKIQYLSLIGGDEECCPMLLSDWGAQVRKFFVSGKIGGGVGALRDHFQAMAAHILQGKAGQYGGNIMAAQLCRDIGMGDDGSIAVLQAVFQNRGFTLNMQFESLRQIVFLWDILCRHMALHRLSKTDQGLFGSKPVLFAYHTENARKYWCTRKTYIFCA